MGASINFIALFVAAFVSTVIGFLWYSPMMFGNQWMKLTGTKKPKKGKKPEGMMQSMIAGFIATLVTAYVLSLFLGVVSDAVQAAGIGFYIWLGFIAPIMLGIVLWEKKPFQLYVINVTYQLVSVVVMAMVLAMMNTW